MTATTNEVEQALDRLRRQDAAVPEPGSTSSIAEMAERTGVSAHTLRYYERAGLLEPVERGSGGHRRYDDEDLVRIQFLTKLRSTGMPIRQIREYAELMRGGDETHEFRLALLEAHRDAVRAHLAETERNLELIDYKIDYYRERLGQR
jgi:DNA-binding transcriptional MerR regulator